jgi:DNA-binding response OmpR family regulator
MIRLIVTANDELYEQLNKKARAEGDSVQRATDVLDGYRQAKMLGQDAIIIVDMSLSTADTLVETLHSRHATAHIPLLAVQCDRQPLPLALRRLCTDVVEADAL